MIQQLFDTKPCFRCFWEERQSLVRNIKEREKNKNKPDLGVGSDFKEFTNWPELHVHKSL